MRRIPQPPVNPAQRDREEHEFWPGFVLCLIGALLALAGARHVTGVDTIGGGTASERQLIKACSSGGLQFASQLPPPAPPRVDDPAAAPEALERWANLQAMAGPPAWIVRVDTAAQTPCPT